MILQMFERRPPIGKIQLVNRPPNLIRARSVCAVAKLGRNGTTTAKMSGGWHKALDSTSPSSTSDTATSYAGSWGIQRGKT
jgi:hypothetical protein